MRSSLFAFLLFLAFTPGCADAPDDHTARMAEEHADDTPEATAIVRAPMLPVEGQPVTYGTVDGSAVTGYLARPTRPDSVARARGLAAGQGLPGIIVIHEWWGLNENIRAMADRLAGEGYTALAVDLYGGQVAETPDAARGLMGAAMQNTAAATANLTSAYAYLTNQENAPAVASIGWCFGGGMSLNAALALPDDLDGAIIYYGRVTDDRAQLGTLGMPVLGFFGGLDQGIPVDGVRAFETALKALGKDAAIYVYDDANHAFANPSGGNFNPEAARDAWDKTTAFLRAHLYGMAG